MLTCSTYFTGCKCGNIVCIVWESNPGHLAISRNIQCHAFARNFPAIVRRAFPRQLITCPRNASSKRGPESRQDSPKFGGKGIIKQTWLLTSKNRCRPFSSIPASSRHQVTFSIRSTLILYISPFQPVVYYYSSSTCRIFKSYPHNYHLIFVD